MSDAAFLMSLGGLIFGSPAFAFCFIGSMSAKNRINDLTARVEQLEAEAGTNNPASDDASD